MHKLSVFIRKYKAPLSVFLLLIFVMSAAIFTPKTEKEEIKAEETEETRAFITKGNDEPLDVTYKEEMIEVLPEERVPVTEEEPIILPEAFPDSDYEREPLITIEDFNEKPTVSASNSITFSPAMPISGENIKPYSSSPLYSELSGSWRSHEAIDISAPLGAEVKSSEKGTIKFIGKDPLLGFYVRISHSGNFETLYANLHGEVTVIEGQTIDKGHVIGYVGESSVTESLDEPHLHFELFKNGKRVNPEEYIK